MGSLRAGLMGGRATGALLLHPVPSLRLRFSAVALRLRTASLASDDECCRRAAEHLIKQGAEPDGSSV